MANNPHSIPVPEAAALTLRWRKNLPSGAFHGARFDRVAFETILAQPACTGIRIYMGLHEASPKDDDTSLWTYVMVGVDAAGNDITSVSAADGTNDDGEVAQRPIPCPPICDDGSPLNEP